MNDSLYAKVRAAAVAGWWTLLIGAIIVTVAFGGYMTAIHHKPAWVACVWGGMSWDAIQSVWMWVIATLKLVLWTMFLIVLWLSLWPRKLKRLQ